MEKNHSAILSLQCELLTECSRGQRVTADKAGGARAADCHHQGGWRTFPP